LLFGFAAHIGLRRIVEGLDAGLLCAAMGMQNALVTRLSGAVVRTTHLTGVITDLGIEAARWLAWGSGRASARLGLRSPREPGAPPAREKVALLATIAGAFTLGALAGATSAVSMGRASALLPASGIAACALYAFRSNPAPPAA
jgi:uncharacterized membrane protein YoaK (UPF0700 family)